MKDLLKALLIPIVGMVGIGTIFLFVTYGGEWEDEITYEPGLNSLATADLGVDATLTYTGECDMNTYRPVCGHDGKSYDNACDAVRSGTRASHLGLCGPR